jgi:hypothetical protein
MEPTINVNKVTLRASQYWMEDGLVELMLGLLMSSQMGVYLAAGALPKGPVTSFVSTFGAQALCVVLTLSILGGFKKLKERITSPRTGYVALPTPSRKYRAVTMFVLIGVAVGLGLSILWDPDTEWLSRIAMPAYAAVSAGCLIRGGLQYKQPSMLWEGLLTLLFAASLNWFTSLRGMKEVGALMVVVGICMASIGALRFRNFLKANPRRQESEA